MRMKISHHISYNTLLNLQNFFSYEKVSCLLSKGEIEQTSLHVHHEILCNIIKLQCHNSENLYFIMI